MRGFFPEISSRYRRTYKKICYQQYFIQIDYKISLKIEVDVTPCFL